MCTEVQSLRKKHINHTNLSAVTLEPHAAEVLVTGSANLESCELLGRFSALLGRNTDEDVWFDDSVPEAEEGLEFADQTFGTLS